MNLVDTTKAAILDEVDWDALNRRLCVYAYRLADGMPGVFDGISPEDLVGEAITAFYADPEGLGWDPTTQDNLARFLCGVLKNKFMTHRRRSWSREGFPDEQPVLKLIGGPPRHATMAERIKAVAEGNRDLEEFVEASQDIEDGGNINQLLSERLNTTVRDVINRRRRLRRGLRKADWTGRNCAPIEPTP